MSSLARDIADQLAAELAEHPPGVKVATEHALVDRFSISRATARAALGELERRHLVRRVRGVGTVTVRRVDYVISPRVAPSWSRTITAAGATPRTVVLGCDPGVLPDAAAARLGVPERTPCHVVSRRSFIDDLPAAWGIEWVIDGLHTHLPTAVRVEQSLDRILREVAGVVPARTWSRVSIEAADAEIADGLQCRTGDAVWLIDSTISDRESARPLMFTRRWIRADAIRVVVES